MMPGVFSVVMAVVSAFFPQAFEVASVKANKSVDTGFFMGCYIEGTIMVPRGMCIGRNVTLRTLVGYAYNIDAFLTADSISGGPGWVTTDRFDIRAKAENPLASDAELRQMLQTLLVERFKLLVHEEKKDIPGFAIVIGRGGLKLKPVTENTRPFVRALRALPN
jgi:uncharacterized protein (TIGR03435 family)